MTEKKRSKKDWNLPTQEELFRPILEVSARYPAGTTLQQLYKECKALFPNLTAADFALRTGKKPENAWNLNVTPNDPGRPFGNAQG